MERRWVGKNVDLALLGEQVRSFFEDRGCKIKKDQSTSEYTVVARTQRRSSILENIVVRILGDSNDFLIEFLTSGRSRSTVKLGILTTLLGGGSLVLRGLKSQEEIEKLEKEFWIFIEEAVAHLIKSTS